MRIPFIITCILLLATACQTNTLPPEDLPTVVVFPSPTTIPPLSDSPTPESISPVTETPIPLPAMTTAPLRIMTPTPIVQTLPSATPVPVIVSDSPPVVPAAVMGHSANPVVNPTLLPEAFIFGYSVEGRELNAYRLGTGNTFILLVGGIHTGYETNTVRLLEEMRDHFTASPNEILPGIGLVLVPVLNPDGLTAGRQIQGRFNANNVDLNRNWGCGWSDAAVFRATPVNPGGAAFSEPETLALGSLIQQIRPATALFYHAAARGVFPGNCGQFVSDGLAQVYSAASGYPYSAEFTEYTVTGSAPGWVDSLGIPAADVELATAEDTELTRNLNAIRAVMAWLTANQ